MNINALKNFKKRIRMGRNIVSSMVLSQQIIKWEFIMHLVEVLKIVF